MIIQLLQGWWNALPDRTQKDNALTFRKVIKRKAQLIPGRRGVTRQPMGDATVCPCKDHPSLTSISPDGDKGAPVLTFQLGGLSATRASRLQAIATDYFSRPVVMSGDNSLACFKECGRWYEGEEWCLLGCTPPPFLIICLVRWDYIRGSRGYSKRNNNPVIPDAELALPFHSAGIDKPSVEAKYRLCAAALHKGEPYSGHYTAVVRHKDKFFHINDASVEEVDVKGWSATGLGWGDIDPQKAGYVFFYERL